MYQTSFGGLVFALLTLAGCALPEDGDNDYPIGGDLADASAMAPEAMSWDDAIVPLEYLVSYETDERIPPLIIVDPEFDLPPESPPTVTQGPFVLHPASRAMAHEVELTSDPRQVRAMRVLSAGNRFRFSPSGN